MTTVQRTVSALMLGVWAAATPLAARDELAAYFAGILRVELARWREVVEVNKIEKLN